MQKPVLAALALFTLIPAATLADPAPIVDPKAKEVLDAMSAFYKGLNTATCTYTLDLLQQVADRKDSMQLDFGVAVERPNKISFIQGKSTDGVDIVCDGKTLTVSVPPLKKYVVDQAPDTIADALESGALTKLGAFNSIIGELMGPDPAGAFLEGVSEAKYVGEEDLDGRKHHRIRMIQEDMDVDVWIASGEKPFVSRMAPDMAKAISNPDVKVTLNINLAGWKGNEPIAPERFVYNAPAGLTKVASFDALFSDGEVYPAEALVGKPATAFKLNGLDGKPVDLATYLGKNVIVLDFWATWCGPCAKSLPIMTEVTDSFKDKGVVFIAVNLGEGPDEIKDFLKARNLNPKVALDSDNTVANQYRVKPIPQSVLIGKNGTVEAVHIGASPILRQQLQRQLNALVAGKSLIEKAS